MLDGDAPISDERHLADVRPHHAGVGLAVVNDFCRAPRGVTLVPFEGLAPRTYWAVRDPRRSFDDRAERHPENIRQGGNREAFAKGGFDTPAAFRTCRTR